MAPYRAVKEKKKYKLVYTDHLSSLLTLKNLPIRRIKKEDKKTIWNLRKENAWTEYKNVSDAFSKELEKVVEDNNISIQEAMDKFEKIHEKIKFIVFGKVSINIEKKRKCAGETKGDTEENAKELYEEQIKTVETEIEKIKESNNGKAGQIWKIREKVIGGKKNKILPSAIYDPKTNKLIAEKDNIKEVTLSYCVDTLTSNTPEIGFQKVIKEKKERVKQILDMTDGCFQTSFETFRYNIKKFQRSGKRNYDFLTKAGPEFQKVVLKMCQRMFSEETFPKQFQETTLHMLFKGGHGKQNILENNSFIHCKEWWPRVAESLVVEDGLKEPLINGSYIYIK